MDIWIVENASEGLWIPMIGTCRNTRADARKVRDWIYRNYEREGLDRPALRVRAYVRDPFRRAR